MGAGVYPKFINVHHLHTPLPVCLSPPRLKRGIRTRHSVHVHIDFLAPAATLAASLRLPMLIRRDASEQAEAMVVVQAPMQPGRCAVHNAPQL